MKTKTLLFLVLISFICAKQLRFLAPTVAKNGKQTPGEASGIVKVGMDLLGVVNQTGAAQYMNYVGLIIDAAATVIKTFASSNTRTFQERVKGTGYKTFAGDFDWDFTIGHRYKGYYDHWMNQMIEQFKVPKEYEADFRDCLETGSISKKETFSSNSFMKDKEKKPVYDKDGNRIITFINIMLYHYRKNRKIKFDAILSSAEIRVKLFPNKLIYKREKIVAGGINRKSSYEFEWENRDFTAADIDAIMDFFQLTTYNELAKNLGIMTNILV